MENEEYPEQLELDLGIKSEWDDNVRYSIVYISFSFLRELTDHQYEQLIDAILDVVDDQSWPDFVMSGSISSGTDRDLCPEAYNESEESNRAD